MKRQKLNNKRYNDLKSDLDPVLIKKDAAREARLNGKREIQKELIEVNNAK